MRSTPRLWFLAAALVSLSCVDAVTAPGDPVASVAVTPATDSLAPGDTVRLQAVARNAAGQPLSGRAITWRSDDSLVARVSTGGLVTAVGAGTTTIRATSEGKSGSATIRVMEASSAPGPVESVELDRAILSLSEGDEDRLTATPRDAAGRAIGGLGMQWTSSDPGVVRVDALGGLTAIKVGTATVSVRVHGRDAEAAVTVRADYGYDLVYALWALETPPVIRRLDIRTANAQPQPFLADVEWVTRVAFSPDGRKIAYVVDWSGSHSSIFVADRDGGNRVRLTTALGRNDQPTWSPDGEWIAFRRWNFNAQIPADILVIRAADGSGEVNLTADQGNSSEHDPAWSPAGPGGSRIAYSRNAGDGTLALWTMRPDGSDKRQITATHADSKPAWSPDGQTIVFERSNQGIAGDLYLVNAAGGNERVFVSLPYGQWDPSYSPDGKLVMFRSKHEDGEYRIYTVWADGSKLARRTQGPGGHEAPVWLVR